MPIRENDAPYLAALINKRNLINVAIDKQRRVVRERRRWKLSDYTEGREEVQTELEAADTRDALIATLRDATVPLDNAGNEFRIVPDVVGDDIATASGKITALGFPEPTEIQRELGEPYGVVTRQSHAASTSVSLTTTIRLTVSVAPPV